MATDEKTKEYVLLRYFEELTLPARCNLVKLDFDAIERIDANIWFDRFEGSSAEQQKKFAKRIIQFEIIAKIIIMVEDLSILAESRLRDTNYYELLDKSTLEEDVGLITKNFYENLDSLSDDKICKIMSYSMPEKLELDEECTILLNTCLKKDIKEIRRILKVIRDFGKEHHPVFRRYKHAGFPILPEFPIVDGLPNYLKEFDFLSAVSVNQEEMTKQPKIIPFSNDVLVGYSIIINGLKRILGDITKNRIVCIQKDLEGIPNVGYFSGQTFTKEEHLKLEAKLRKFNDNFPAKYTKFNLGVDSNFDKSGTWYEKLPEFLAECRIREQTDKEYREKLR